jgi:hypothetical protein
MQVDLVDLSALAPEEYLWHLQRIDQTRQLLREEAALLDKQFDELVIKCNKCNIKENDFLYLKCKVSERRSVHVPSFVKLFPDAVKTLKEQETNRIRMQFGQELDRLVENGLTKINVKDAEDLVGKIPLQPAVVISRTETYSIIEKNQNRE